MAESNSSRGSKLPRHIVMIRLSALGDVAMLPHAVRALHEAYPDVRVTVLTRPMLRPLFDGLDVDFLMADTKNEHRGIKGIWRLARQVKELGADAVADTHGVLRSRLLCLFARLRGIRTRRIRKGHIEKWFRMGYSRKGAVPLKHTVVRYCDTIRRLGFRFDDPQPPAKPSFPNPMGEKRGTWIGFAPFSAHAGKTYPADLRDELTALLSERYDRVFIHSGGGQEAAFANRMEEIYPNVTALWGKVKLDGERNLISHLDCVVSMDSLVMHIASLTATPVVSIWGATHHEFGFLGYGCDPSDILEEDMPCRPCSVYGNRRCKYGDYRCLRAITPEIVVDKVDEVLARTGDRQG